LSFKYTIETRSGYIRAEMQGRDTAEETREFVQALVEALRSQALSKALISVRESRPIFRVEGWNLSGFLDLVRDIKALKIAFVSDSKELAMSQEYIALLGRQHGFAFQAFGSEQEAVAWLMA
jgi:hypothetical protein